MSDHPFRDTFAEHERMRRELHALHEVAFEQSLTVAKLKSTVERLETDGRKLDRRILWSLAAIGAVHVLLHTLAVCTR